MLKVVGAETAPAPKPERLPLGRHLVNDGVITPVQLVRALELQARLNAPLGEILISEGWASARDVMSALARQHELYHADLRADPPEPHLVTGVPTAFWLKHRVVPWMRLGRALVIATSRPDKFAEMQAEWPGRAPGLLPVIADEDAILGALARLHRAELARAASTRLADRYSCRRWGHTPLLTRPKVTAIVATIVAIFAVFGTTAFAVLSIFALTTLCLIAGLKITGAVACMTAAVEPRNDTPPPPDGRPYRRPKVSVLVPLFREKEIAGRLISRLSKLTYPKVLLDVVLVLEEKDQVTREALEGTDLPAWMRVIEVPAHGGLTTKPRAMNYALDFCDGDIIGIWDAEDAPEPDQIDRAVSRFANAPQDVVCLQGVLDYYNPRTNWIARCFTIEYASWWRVILPGLARMGLVIPLGGTTLFFRRDKLEELGGWDAHNVTEDADLGVRLAREGYRTELFPAVTYEEANYRPWPWIKQRSRWLKGFMVTYLVHMRQPRQLWRDVGPRRFLGLQAFFIGTVSQFLLAPVLWSFWAIIFGAPHPVLNVIPSPAVWGLTFLFLFVEIANITIGMTAVSGAQHRHLMRWVPILLLYFPMGAVASYKALIELVVSPFYWDKTQHGQAEADEGTGIDDPMPPEQEY